MKSRHHVLTREGKEMLQAELEYLRKVRRPQVVERLRRLREQGPGQTYGEYQEAKDEGALVEGRIRDLELLLAEAQVASGAPSGAVVLGSRVVVVDDEGEQDEYLIVGSAEADARARRISHESPVGQALLGHRSGDVVEAQTPAGPLRLRIISVA